MVTRRACAAALVLAASLLGGCHVLPPLDPSASPAPSITPPTLPPPTRAADPTPEIPPPIDAPAGSAPLGDEPVAIPDLRRGPAAHDP